MCVANHLVLRHFAGVIRAWHIGKTTTCELVLRWPVTVLVGDVCKFQRLYLQPEVTVAFLSSTHPILLDEASQFYFLCRRASCVLLVHLPRKNAAVELRDMGVAKDFLLRQFARVARLAIEKLSDHWCCPGYRCR